MVEIEVEPALAGGLFGLDGDSLDARDVADPTGRQDDAGTDVDSGSGRGASGSSAANGGAAVAQSEDALPTTSLELLGQVVAVDEDAGTIDLRLMPAEGLTGTNGLTLAPGGDPLIGGAVTATATVTATRPLTDTDDAGGTGVDRDQPGSDAAPAGDRLSAFPVTDPRAWPYYLVGTMVEIEIDLEPSAVGASGPFCTTGAHPLAGAIAETYGADVEAVRAWYCDHNLGFGEIMLALTTARLSDEPAAGLVNRRLQGQGWAEIWQGLGLIGRLEDAGAPDDRLGDDQPCRGRVRPAGRPDDTHRPTLKPCFSSHRAVRGHRPGSPSAICLLPEMWYNVLATKGLAALAGPRLDPGAGWAPS